MLQEKKGDDNIVTTWVTFFATLQGKKKGDDNVVAIAFFFAQLITPFIPSKLTAFCFLDFRSLI
jgi:hypothetical protein